MLRDVPTGSFTLFTTVHPAGHDRESVQRGACLSVGRYACASNTSAARAVALPRDSSCSMSVCTWSTIAKKAGSDLRLSPNSCSNTASRNTRNTLRLRSGSPGWMLRTATPIRCCSPAAESISSRVSSAPSVAPWSDGLLRAFLAISALDSRIALNWPRISEASCDESIRDIKGVPESFWALLVRGARLLVVREQHVRYLQLLIRAADVHLWFESRRLERIDTGNYFLHVSIQCRIVFVVHHASVDIVTSFDVSRVGQGVESSDKILKGIRGLQFPEWLPCKKCECFALRKVLQQAELKPRHVHVGLEKQYVGEAVFRLFDQPQMRLFCCQQIVWNCGGRIQLCCAFEEIECGGTVSRSAGGKRLQDFWRKGVRSRAHIPNDGEVRWDHCRRICASHQFGAGMPILPPGRWVAET